MKLCDDCGGKLEYESWKYCLNCINARTRKGNERYNKIKRKAREQGEADTLKKLKKDIMGFHDKFDYFKEDGLVEEFELSCGNGDIEAITLTKILNWIEKEEVKK